MDGIRKVLEKVTTYEEVMSQTEIG
jgi:hypothetical protein